MQNQNSLYKRKNTTHLSMIVFQFHKHDWTWLGYLFAFLKIIIPGQKIFEKIVANHDPVA